MQFFFAIDTVLTVESRIGLWPALAYSATQRFDAVPLYFGVRHIGDVSHAH
jgi:hypothetical protein